MFPHDTAEILDDLAAATRRHSAANGARVVPRADARDEMARGGAQTGRRPVRRPRVEEAQRQLREQALLDVAANVTDRLPWRGPGGLPVQMQVVDVGYVDADDETAPPGRPYVVIGVASWDAADAVHEAFRDISYLDDDDWVLDWLPSESSFRTIRVPLNQDALEQHS